MKKIGVLLPTFTIEYCYDILEGIYSYFKDKNVQVIIAQTKYPHSTECIFDYQHWASVEYLKSKDIDAIIVFSGVYCSTLDEEAFKKIMQGFKDKPIISIAANLGIRNSYTIKLNCNKVYEDIVSHLKNVHHCQRIAFMSASATGSPEAIQREECFLDTLKKAKIQFHAEDMFQGGFMDEKAEKAIRSVIAKPSDVKFDAIVAANDDMAVGIINAFNDIGVRVPEDVKVIGFDDSTKSAIMHPTISTINQQVVEQGITAAQTAFKLVNGERCPKIIYTDLHPKFKQSCGCIDSNENQKIYKKLDGTIASDHNSKYEGVSYFINEMNEKNNFITLMDMVKGSNTLKQFYYNVRFLVDQCDMNNMCISFFNEAIYLDSNEDFVLPNEQEVTILCDRRTEIELFKPGIKYDPHKTIVPTRTLSSRPGIYILSPIFSGEGIYGNLLCSVKGTKFADYNVYLKILITAISQSFEYTTAIVETEKLETENIHLQNDNKSLNKQSRTDELTNIYNRRGFMEVGQRNLDLIQEMDTPGVIFFADMDGLKSINDSFGHNMGDRAIQLEAEILKSAFRSTDIVGRISGDEFGIVAVGMKINDVEKIRLKIQLLNEKVSRENKLPFTLSLSLGAVDLQKSSVLKKLLTEADKDLYIQKKIKREKRLKEQNNVKKVKKLGK